MIKVFARLNFLRIKRTL